MNTFKIKKLALRLVGRYKHLKQGVQCPHEWYGNDYGGFYVCPSLLNEDAVVYSFGIGEDISFDIKMYQEQNCHVFCFDPTPKSIQWIEQQDLPQNIHFHPFGISSKTGIVDFYLPQNTDHVSGSLVQQKNIDTKRKVSVPMKSLTDIMQELGHSQIDVLKMDIEGSEYEIIESIIENKIPITQLLIEFHDRFFPDGRERTIRAVQQLKEAGYEIFGVSNSLEEVSFIRKDAL